MRRRRIATLLALALWAVFALCIPHAASAAAAVLASSASPAGCPPTEEADALAKGRVIAAPGWVHRWFHPERAWQFGTGAGVTVAIVDTGINQHRQLGGQVYAGPGHDFVRNSGDGRLDCTGRGTALASIVAAQPAPGSGLIGFAYRAKLLAVRVSERSWGFTPHAGDRDVTSARLAAGVRWAADNGAHVINVSLALNYDAPDLRDAVAHALAKGAVVVAAVGKDHFYPAAYPGVIGVGAISADGQRVEAAHAHVDLYAPGVAIDVAARDTDHFSWLGGADAASAVVSAAAALVKSAAPAPIAARQPTPPTPAATGQPTAPATVAAVAAPAAAIADQVAAPVAMRQAIAPTSVNQAAPAAMGAAAAAIGQTAPTLTGEQVRARLISTASGGLVDPFRAMTELHPAAVPAASPTRAPPITAAAPPPPALTARALSAAGVLIGLTILIGYVVRLRGSRRRPRAHSPTAR